MLVEEAFDASKKVIYNLGEVRVKPARKKSTVNIAAEQILEAQTEDKVPNTTVKKFKPLSDKKALKMFLKFFFYYFRLQS